jgi:histidinol-phosphate/aromatic aminotransferase/cobyric acid decarboxylase-like protein
MISVDLSQFKNTQHSPAFLRLEPRAASELKTSLRDFCVPANPYFPTPGIYALLKENLETLLKFYPSSNETISHDLSRALELDPKTLVVANGSTKLITWIHELLMGDTLTTDVPTFGKWTDLPLMAGKRLHPFQRRAEDDFALDVDGWIRYAKQMQVDSLVLCNPNNPTSQIVSKSEVLHLVDSLPELRLIVIDESFIDFSGSEIPSIAGEAVTRPNLILLKSLGKSFGLHGMRAGYAVANHETAQRLREKLPGWNINAITEYLIRIFPNFLEEYELSRQLVIQDTRYLYETLSTIPGLKVYEPHSNFVYVHLLQGDGKYFRDELLTRFGFLIRECGNKIGSSSQYFRIAARPVQDTEKLVTAIGAILPGRFL